MRTEKAPYGWPPPPDDGTAWRPDGTREGDAIGGVLIILAVLFAVGVALVAWGAS